MEFRTRFKLIGAFTIAAAVIGGWWIAAASKEKVQPVKEFYLDVSEFEHEFYPGGPKVMVWGFNRQIPGPTIRVTEGDRVRVHLINRHTSNHTLHFHGLNVPNEMDGVAYGPMHHLEVEPGQTHVYEFTADPPGTHMYHCHVNSPQHIDMGMSGVMIVEPKDKRGEPKVDKEQVLLLDDWYINDKGLRPHGERRLPGAFDASARPQLRGNAQGRPADQESAGAGYRSDRPRRALRPCLHGGPTGNVAIPLPRRAARDERRRLSRRSARSGDNGAEECAGEQTRAPRFN